MAFIKLRAVSQHASCSLNTRLNVTCRAVLHIGHPLSTSDAPLDDEAVTRYRDWQVRSTLEKDVELLQQQLEQLKAACLLNTEKLDYNYQVSTGGRGRNSTAGFDR